MEIEICTDAQYWDACMEEYNGSVFHCYEWGKLMELLPVFNLPSTNRNTRYSSFISHVCTG